MVRVRVAKVGNRVRIIIACNWQGVCCILVGFLAQPLFNNFFVYPAVNVKTTKVDNIST